MNLQSRGEGLAREGVAGEGKGWEDCMLQTGDRDRPW